MSLDEKWEYNFNELITFININKKTPSNKSEILEEKQIGNWYSSQKTYYKNKTNGMKDKYRYDNGIIENDCEKLLIKN